MIGKVRNYMVGNIRKLAPIVLQEACDALLGLIFARSVLSREGEDLDLVLMQGLIAVVEVVDELTEIVFFNLIGLLVRIDSD